MRVCVKVCVSARCDARVLCKARPASPPRSFKNPFLKGTEPRKASAIAGGCVFSKLRITVDCRGMSESLQVVMPRAQGRAVEKQEVSHPAELASADF